ncbi:MAG: tetratricopeptide repeat protein [Reichenbachiella sp.]|uniref:tetratricopeptide repeat protein n=1 Tax=Reichenbachiella sp. TaxID=2184521 RepID=UPI003265B9C6
MLKFQRVLCILLFIVTHQIFSQTHSIDSLQLTLRTSTGHDRIDILNSLMALYKCDNDSVALTYYQSITKSPAFESYPRGLAKALENYGDIKHCLGELDSTIHYYKKAVKIGQDHELEKDLGQLLSSLGYFYQSAGNFDSSTYYLRRGKDFAKKVGDSLSIGSTSVGLGIMYQHRGQIDSAMNNYIYALRIAEQIDEKPLAITAKLNIATLYYDHQPHKLRTSDFLEMLQITRDIGDVAREISVLEWLGYLKTDSGEFDLALKYFEEGLEVNQKEKNKNSEVQLLQGISYAHNMSGNYQQAILSNNQVIEIAHSLGYDQYLPSAYANNVTNYIALKAYKKAIDEGLRAIEVGEKSRQKELYYKVYKDLAVAYRELGDFKGAYKAQFEYTKLSNEILDATKSKQLTELETKYETEKKEAEIAALSQQSTIQALEIKQKNIAILVGVILLVLIASGVYMVLRQRTLKSKQAQMELEQRFLRSQLNPHFISNALLAVQNFMLKKQPEEAAIYLSKFSKLMRETLENSRQEFILLEDELQMLTNFMDIHKMRMDDAFDYQIHIGDNIDPETDTIPPMFVQPFVENAIEHGISQAKGKGQINLHFEKEGEYISIVVKDNGGGFEQSRPGAGDHTSLSSTIIQERMDIFNKTLKKKIQLILGNIEGEGGEIQGTKVELKVPFSYI